MPFSLEFVPEFQIQVSSMIRCASHEFSDDLTYFCTYTFYIFSLNVYIILIDWYFMLDSCGCGGLETIPIHK